MPWLGGRPRVPGDSKVAYAEGELEHVWEVCTTQRARKKKKKEDGCSVEGRGGKEWGENSCTLLGKKIPRVSKIRNMFYFYFYFCAFPFLMDGVSCVYVLTPLIFVFPIQRTEFSNKQKKQNENRLKQKRAIKTRMETRKRSFFF